SADIVKKLWDNPAL
uniref:Polybine-1 n=1 Tax=Polybia paulista TaxID=291283 RepID=PLYB1_POLPI|nr:RecName: Full=Polybine-1; AltName: Full=Polybine-I [Polybia paulista]